MKKIIVLLLLSLILIVGCSPRFQYVTPKDKSCDFSEKNICLENGCRWRTLTDVVNSDPMPATCCPLDSKINTQGYDKEDPCSWVIG